MTLGKRLQMLKYLHTTTKETLVCQQFSICRSSYQIMTCYNFNKQNRNKYNNLILQIRELRLYNLPKLM